MDKNIKKLKREKFLSAAGGWSDIDTDGLIKDIYKDRKKGTKRNIKFD